MNLKAITEVIYAVRDYLFPYDKIQKNFTKIDNPEELTKFIKERSAYVTQTTLYGYLKTRMGLKYTLMFNDEVFLGSINKSKWNIFVASVSDLSLYSVSYLMNNNQLKENEINIKQIFSNIIDHEVKNGLGLELAEQAKINFFNKISQINITNYLNEEPFKLSCEALYHWAPIAIELKELDKEIVLNSIKNKWNAVIADFKNLSKNY